MDNTHPQLIQLTLEEFMKEKCLIMDSRVLQDPYPSPLPCSWEHTKQRKENTVISGNERLDEALALSTEPHTEEVERIHAGFVLTESNPLTHFDPPTSTKTSNEVEYENGPDVGGIWSSITFCQGQKPHLSPDMEHVFLPVCDLTLLRMGDLLKIIVGVLNGGRRGAVYLGLSIGGVVEGVLCCSSTLTTFTKGLTTALLHAVVPPPVCGVRGHRVNTGEGATHDAWVIEILLLPQKHKYYSFPGASTYYHHQDGRLHCVPFPVFCQRVVEHCAETFRREVENEQDEIQQIQELLETRRK